ncbi:hypothetical protein QWZ13_00475 [Reinekea marina]|nr:hypothetical protein [Reinekea marina]MDN3647377.1 hypothetical protein [Reinekea marina]
MAKLSGAGCANSDPCKWNTLPMRVKPVLGRGGFSCKFQAASCK